MPLEWQRPLVAATLSAVAFGLALGGAAVTSDPANGINAAVEGLSADSGRVLAQIAELLPLGFVFAAGMVSAVNPCGFVLLPAYLGVFLGESDASRPLGVAARVRRGVVVGATVTLALVLVFAVVGMLVGSVASLLVGTLPWLGLAVGVALIVTAGYRVAGGAAFGALPYRISAQLSGGLAAPRAAGLRAYFAYGLAYGLASLSCTLPIFLAVLGGSVAADGVVPVLGRLATYGLGMGTLIVGVTIAAALFGAAVLRRLRWATRVVQPAGTALLFLAGSYVVYYWLTVGGLFVGQGAPRS